MDSTLHPSSHSLTIRPTPPLLSPGRGAYCLGVHHFLPQAILGVRHIQNICVCHQHQVVVTKLHVPDGLGGGAKPCPSWILYVPRFIPRGWGVLRCGGGSAVRIWLLPWQSGQVKQIGIMLYLLLLRLAGLNTLKKVHGIPSHRTYGRAQSLLSEKNNCQSM